MHSLQLTLQIYFIIQYSTAYNYICIYIYTHTSHVLKNMLFLCAFTLLCTNTDFVGPTLPAHYDE